MINDIIHELEDEFISSSIEKSLIYNDDSKPTYKLLQKQKNFRNVLTCKQEEQALVQRTIRHKHHHIFNDIMFNEQLSFAEKVEIHKQQKQMRRQHRDLQERCDKLVLNEMKKVPKDKRS